MIKQLADPINDSLEAYAISRTKISDLYNEKINKAEDQAEKSKLEDEAKNELEAVAGLDIEIEIESVPYEYMMYSLDEVVFSWKNQDGTIGVQGSVDNDMVLTMIDSLEAATGDDDIQEAVEVNELEEEEDE